MNELSWLLATFLVGNSKRLLLRTASSCFSTAIQLRSQEKVPLSPLNSSTVVSIVWFCSAFLEQCFSFHSMQISVSRMQMTPQSRSVQTMPSPRDRLSEFAMFWMQQQPPRRMTASRLQTLQRRRRLQALLFLFLLVSSRSTVSRRISRTKMTQCVSLAETMKTGRTAFRATMLSWANLERKNGKGQNHWFTMKKNSDRKYSTERAMPPRLAEPLFSPKQMASIVSCTIIRKAKLTTAISLSSEASGRQLALSLLIRFLMALKRGTKTISSTSSRFIGPTKLKFARMSGDLKKMLCLKAWMFALGVLQAYCILRKGMRQVKAESRKCVSLDHSISTKYSRPRDWVSTAMWTTSSEGKATMAAAVRSSRKKPKMLVLLMLMLAQTPVGLEEYPSGFSKASWLAQPVQSLQLSLVQVEQLKWHCCACCKIAIATKTINSFAAIINHCRNTKPSGRQPRSIRLLHKNNAIIVPHFLVLLTLNFFDLLYTSTLLSKTSTVSMVQGLTVVALVESCLKSQGGSSFLAARLPASHSSDSTEERQLFYSVIGLSSPVFTAALLRLVQTAVIELPQPIYYNYCEPPQVPFQQPQWHYQQQGNARFTRLPCSIGYIRLMEAIKRISEFFGKYPQPELRKKTSSFKPVTRLEMIRHKSFVYPASTESKFIFVANLDGSGFQRQSFPLCPREVPLDEMVHQVNRVCYRQWERNRNHYTGHPFAGLDRFSNVSFVLAAALSVLLLVMIVYGNANSLNNALFVFACFLASSLAACLVAYFTSVPSYNADSRMVQAIRQQLSEFNRAEARSGSARFVWTAHQDCLWIAMRLLAPQSRSSSPCSEERQ